MIGPVSAQAARGGALRADLRAAGRPPRLLAHPDPGSWEVADADRSGGRR